MMLSPSFSFGFAAQRVSERSEPAIYTNIGEVVFMGGSWLIRISEPAGTDPFLRPGKTRRMVWNDRPGFIPERTGTRRCRGCPARFANAATQGVGATGRKTNEAVQAIAGDFSREPDRYRTWR